MPMSEDLTITLLVWFFSFVLFFVHKLMQSEGMHSSIAFIGSITLGLMGVGIVLRGILTYAGFMG